MKQVSVGKLCQWHERGVSAAPGAARPRFSGHLPASACIWEVLSRQTSGAQGLYFVSLCFILFHLLGACWCSG